MDQRGETQALQDRVESDWMNLYEVCHPTWGPLNVDGARPYEPQPDKVVTTACCHDCGRSRVLKVQPSGGSSVAYKLTIRLTQANGKRALQAAITVTARWRRTGYNIPWCARVSVGEQLPARFLERSAWQGGIGAFADT
jgi:hypothetical protein